MDYVEVTRRGRRMDVDRDDVWCSGCKSDSIWAVAAEEANDEAAWFMDYIPDPSTIAMMM